VAKTDGGDLATKRFQAAAAPSQKSKMKEMRGGGSSGKSKTKSKAGVTPIRVKMVSPAGTSATRAVKEPPEGLPPKYFLKSTFNTHDIMHSPVEKTLKMLDKILTGERLFTM